MYEEFPCLYLFFVVILRKKTVQVGHHRNPLFLLYFKEQEDRKGRRTEIKDDDDTVPKSEFLLKQDNENCGLCVFQTQYSCFVILFVGNFQGSYQKYCRFWLHVWKNKISWFICFTRRVAFIYLHFTSVQKRKVRLFQEYFFLYSTAVCRCCLYSFHLCFEMFKTFCGGMGIHWNHLRLKGWASFFETVEREETRSKMVLKGTKNVGYEQNEEN